MPLNERPKLTKTEQAAFEVAVAIVACLVITLVALAMKNC